MPVELTERDLQRFWAKVNKGTAQEEDACWLWTGARYKQLRRGQMRRTYGVFRVQDRTLAAHRLVWMYLHQCDVPPGLCVLHSCDMTACVNPAHLFLGTHADNNRDCIAKGRARHDGNPRGERVGVSKLSEDQVKRIRRLYVPRKYSTRRLAREFGVSQCVIVDVIHRRTWRHVCA